MKKKINILCALVFVILALSVIPVFYFITLGIKHGIDAGVRDARTGTQEYHKKYDALMQYKTTTLFPNYKFVEEMEEGTIRNDVTGKNVEIIPMRIMVNVEPENPGVYNTVDNINTVIQLILYIAIIVMFIRFIANVNHKEVFTWQNLKLLRKIGYCLIALTVISVCAGIYEEYLISEVFRVKGFSASYMEYFYSTDFIIGIVTLIIAEAFAIGLKQKEELELTV